MLRVCWLVEKVGVCVPGEPRDVGIAWQWSTKLAMAVSIGVCMRAVSFLWEGITSG